jgi:hypothetical protein
VREVAQWNQHEEVEQVFLMRALASLEEDELFADMMRRGTPSYLDALLYLTLSHQGLPGLLRVIEG